MMASALSSSYHDYSRMEDIWAKTDSLSSNDAHDDQFDQSFEDDGEYKTNANQRMTNSRTLAVKRPMNAFLLWARGERKRVSSDGHGVSQTSLSKLLGETWRHMSMEEKQPFLDMAETLKKQHHIDHPDYRFKPRHRSVIANKAIAKKHHASPMLQQRVSNMIASPNSSSSSSQYPPQTSISSPISNATPHPIQPAVLNMCQAIISQTLSTSDLMHDWFGKLTKQPQSVILAPAPRFQTSPSTSRRAVRIQIINKHDEINRAPPSILPMTPSPVATAAYASSFSSMVNGSTTSLNDYLIGNQNTFHDSDSHQALATVMDNGMEYGTFQDSSIHHLTDIDQNCDLNGWIDTPLSNMGANSRDMFPSPYASYDFLSL